ncbi:MAG: peroxiredoxin [Desulfurococcales archaeon]|nr:peroxiredoxin [Desulfurococcales archaeon]
MVNPIQPGSKAPDFEAPTHTGGKLRLSDYRGKIVVLYFYPRAMTPGCTREGRRFSELSEEFARLNAVIIGVSTDPPERNKRFAEKEGFKGVILVSDTDGKIAEAYGVLRKKKRISAERATFIIDSDGVVRKVLVNVRPAEKHADLALEAVRELAGGQAS